MIQNIKRAGASISEQTMNNYFDNLEVTLRGVKAGSIVNYNENNDGRPGQQKITHRRGQKHPEKVNDFAKSAMRA